MKVNRYDLESSNQRSFGSYRGETPLFFDGPMPYFVRQTERFECTGSGIEAKLC
jgi:hypothetical protein